MEFKFTAADATEVPPDYMRHITKNYQKRLPVVKFTDMPEKMKNDVISTTHKGMAKHYNEADIAMHIKEYMDSKYRGGKWHVFVGRNINISCNYEVGKYIYFYIGHIGIIVYRTGAL